MKEAVPYQSLLQDTQREILSLIQEKKGWQKESAPSGHGDLKMESRVYRDGLRVFRGTRTIPASAQQLVKATWDGTQEDAQRADSYVKEFRAAKTWPRHPDHRVDYALLHLPWPVWNREVAYAMARVALSPTEWLVVAHSIPESDWAALRTQALPKTILMEVFGCVYYREVGPNRCKVTRVIFGDPKGILPTTLTNRMGGNQVAGLLEFLHDKAVSHKQNASPAVRSRL